VTRKQQVEFDGFIKAKRMIIAAIDSRMDSLSTQEFIIQRQARIWELEEIRNYIRNVALYKAESK
jgi:hypothetical protein